MNNRLQIILTRKVYFITLTALILSALVTPVLADDVDDPEESYYSNPAQAAHAAQLAEEDAKNNEDVTLAWEQYQDALNALGDDATEEELAAVDTLEVAYEEALAAAVGTSADEIETMRDSGMGWGEIAKALDIHPGLLGLGHTKRNKNKYSDEEIADDSADDAAAELAEATARNTQTGYAKGHSYAASNNGKSKSKSSGVDTASSSTDTGSVASSKGNSANAPGQQSKTTTTKTKTNNGNSSSNSNKGGNSSNSNGNKGGNSGK